MRPLTSVVRPYAWGSRTAIAAVQGRPVPSAEPEAELWLGAHPLAPSSVVGVGDRVPLPELIGASPEGTLGAAVTERFGPRLPYLLKFLAAAEPLSLQAHPDAGQARSGFAAEEAQGIEHDRRNYPDPYHKPELLVAVGEFDALCGFRDPGESAALLRSFGVARMTPVIDALAAAGPAEARLRRAMQLLMAWPAGDRDALVDAVAHGGSPAAPEDHRAARALAADLARRYPGDVGVVVALLLNRVRLRPDEAVFMPPGHLHSYLHGVGVEVMAASDNVLRGGLTAKRVDPGELGRVLHYTPLPDPVVQPIPLGDGVLSWPAAVEEFALVKAVLRGRPVLLPGDGPRIVLCVSGAVRLSAGAQKLGIRGGEAAFVAASEPVVEVSGDGGVVFQAAPGPGTQDRGSAGGQRSRATVIPR